MKGIKTLLLGILISILLIGCSNDSIEDAGGSNNSDDRTTIKLHHWYNEEDDNWLEVIKAFEEEHPDIKVESVTPENNDADETIKQIDLEAASGNQLDVIMLNTASQYAQRISQDMFEPLNSYLEKDDIDFEEEYQVDTAVDSTYYGLPGKYNMHFIMLNEDALNDANLEVPTDWTWDEYMDYARQLTEGEGANTRYGTYFHSWMEFVKLALQSQSGDNDLVKMDSVTSNIDHPLLRKSLEIRQQGHEEGSATPYGDVISMNLHYVDQYFNKKAAMIPTGSWMIHEGGGREGEPSDFKTVYAPYPKSEKDDPITSPADSDILAVYSGSEHKEEAYKFIRWYTTKGILIQNKFLPSYKDIELTEVVDNLLADNHNPDMIDKESLVNTLNITQAADVNIPVSFISEVEDVFLNEVEKFLLDEQDLDTTLEKAHKAVQKVIDANVE